MSLTVLCLYMMFGMFLFMFFHYKFLKLFDYCTSSKRILLRKQKKQSQTNGIWSIPGPISLPLIGSKWIYFWKYKMSQIHKVYAGMGN